MTRTLRSWVTAHPVLAAAVLIALTAATLAAFLGVAQATDRSVFCNSCHEMSPYYASWSEGAHANVACVECHVDPGLTNRIGHKFLAMKEVWVHLAGDPSFPMNTSDLVPDSRCMRCHESIRDDLYEGFSHKDHEAKGSCADCHRRVGHDVSPNALEAAGVVNSEMLAAARAEELAVVGKGVANLENHVKTTCENCHDLQATGCPSCHEPGHDPRPVGCTTCHSPGREWAFAHPDATDCTTCHSRPEDHTATGANAECDSCHAQESLAWTFAHPTRTDCVICHARPAGHREGECSRCHAQPGTNWAYTHPAATSSCADCHEKPPKHRSGACQTCHSKAGVSWAFSHPGTGSTCTSCHAKPIGHRSGSCQTCHSKAGVSWAFSHPGTGSTCTSCHARPSGHSGRPCTDCHSVGSAWTFRHPGSSATCTTCHSRPPDHSTQACTTCHVVGSTWAFRHPSSPNCSPCHAAPRSHYGAACSSCHTPSRDWRDATFVHPSIPGGEHTYRSFACANCHPGGFSSHSCTSCHGSDNPDGDD